MDSLPYATPPRWWQPRLAPIFLRFYRPIRVRRQRRVERVAAIEVRGLVHLRQAIEQGHGILITPNHAAHSDPFVLLHVQDRVHRLFYYMVAWQSFQILKPFERFGLQLHGCFTVNREGTDLRAFRQAVDVVQKEPYPLVIFPEGEVYHHCEHVGPFRTGPAAIALTAARRATRPIVCIPAAIRYQYTRNPMPELERLTAAFETRLQWRPHPELPLAERLYRIAEGLLALREVEYRGHAQPGPFRPRVLDLIEFILRRCEAYYAVAAPEGDVPDRVTRLRRLAIAEKESEPPDDARRRQAERNLAAVYTAVQLYSYADDYEGGSPSLEHLAEIVDKFEEDVLHVTTARTRGVRRATIQLGEPVPVPRPRSQREDPRQLTDLLEQRVRLLLEGLQAGQATLPRPDHRDRA